MWQVSKPYNSFFSNENLNSMKVGDEEPAAAQNATEMEDNAAAAYNPGDADQAHGDDVGDFGDGDVDMDDGGGGGGFDED